MRILDNHWVFTIPQEILRITPDWVETIASEVLFALIGIGLTLLWFYWRRVKDRRAFRAGQLREEVIVVANIIEDLGNGVTLLKPRTVQSAEPILRAFPNQALVDEIIAATGRCDTSTAEGSFIILSEPTMHSVFMKRVVDIASELGGIGHIHRMCGLPVVKQDCYACITFSPDGPHRKIRIDLISEANLQRFNDPLFPQSLSGRPEEGSHADIAAIFAVCARKAFGTDGERDESRSYVRRVSIPILDALA